MKNFVKLGRNPSWRLTGGRWLLVLAVFGGSAVICAADEQLMAAAPVAAANAAQATSYLPLGKPEPALLAPPPLPGSPEQAADMAEVVAVHAAATANETGVAFSEKKFSIFSFAPAVGPILQPEKLPKTALFFERVQSDAAEATDRAKVFFKRPRPFITNPSLGSGKLEKSFSYPSGHSTESMVLALVLADLFPDKKDAIIAQARAIGWHRVLIARHYPTDIHAGRTFAQAIVRELKASADFSRDFAEVKAEIAAAQK